MDPATAVAQPLPQPFAAVAAAVASDPAQPSLLQPHSDSVAASELLIHSSADMPLVVNSTGESQRQPVDLTGLVATAVDSSEHAQGLELALQPKMLPGQDEDQGDQQVFREPVRGLADPNKRLFAKMGSEVPGQVSMQLLQEVAARSHVQGLLQVRLAVSVRFKRVCKNVHMCHNALVQHESMTQSLIDNRVSNHFESHSIQECDVTHCSALYMPTRLTSCSKGLPVSNCARLSAMQQQCRCSLPQLIAGTVPSNSSCLMCPRSHSTVLCCAVLCCAVLLCAVLFYAVLCCAVLGWALMRCAVLRCAELRCAQSCLLSYFWCAWCPGGGRTGEEAP